MLDIKNNKPRVSIGLPVYNGENYLKDAINSIMAQTFTDFELIISDNASTDKTSEICKAYAEKDTRIHYYRAEKNLGAAWNFNRVFELSAGEYFKWVAHDDLVSPDYLSKCIEVLDNDDSIILCNSKVEFINEYGDVIAAYIMKQNDVNSRKPQDRFGYLIYFNHFCFDVFGLIRSDALRKTRLIKSYPGSDRALLAELSLIGRFYETPQFLFLHREHEERSTRAYLNLQLRAGWFDTSKEGKITLPRWRIFFEYLISVNHYSLGMYDRACCYAHLGNWLRMYYRGMAKELIFAFKYSLSI